MPPTRPTPLFGSPTAWPEDDPHPPLATLLDPRGRISRRGYWIWGVAVPLALGALLHALLAIARVRGALAEPIVNAALLWPALAVAIKRCHDRDASGAWVLIGLVPVIGWLALLAMNGFIRGTPGPNRFGPVPAG